MTGWVKIAGLGPGSEDLITPEVNYALTQSTDVVGYVAYIARIKSRKGLTLHASDNRVELERAKEALRLATNGCKVVVVSSGDPGVFAMASAVFEALEKGPLEWRDLQIDVLPGITAMIAAAARVGAPLGHDFCAINLSDNLKPWSIIEKRIRLAVKGDFAIGFYNPRSKARPDQFGVVLNILNQMCDKDIPIVFANAVSTPRETIKISSVDKASPDMADMRTLVLVGTSRTRLIERTGQIPYVYTPRSFLI